MITRERKIDLMRVLSRVSTPSLRILLAWAEAESFKDFARALGTSPGVARVRLTEAVREARALAFPPLVFPQKKPRRGLLRREAIRRVRLVKNRKARLAILMLLRDGSSEAEIAEALGLSRAEVKRLLYQAAYFIRC